MRILHTSDWHLGKTLKGLSLIEDQVFILKEFLKIVDDHKPDVILICGDIYDKSNPSPEAIELFDETLYKFYERKLKVLCIAGNHDNSIRLNFGSRLFANNKIFLVTKISENPSIITLEDEFGKIFFSLIPHFEIGEFNKIFDVNKQLTRDIINREYLSFVRQKIPINERSVVLAHVFVNGAIESESERKIVGGSEMVSAQNFDGYNYVALGHLHRSQQILRKNICYSGSPLKYSFDEVEHKKSVFLVEIDSSGKIETQRIFLTPRHDLVVIRKSFEELIKQPTNFDYASIILTNLDFVYDVEEKLKKIFPNLLEVKRECPSKVLGDTIAKNFRKDSSIFEQFANFFEQMTRNSMTEDESEAFKKFLQELECEELRMR